MECNSPAEIASRTEASASESTVKGAVWILGKKSSVEPVDMLVSSLEIALQSVKRVAHQYIWILENYFTTQTGRLFTAVSLVVATSHEQARRVSW